MAASIDPTAHSHARTRTRSLATVHAPAQHWRVCVRACVRACALRAACIQAGQHLRSSTAYDWAGGRHAELGHSMLCAASSSTTKRECRARRSLRCTAPPPHTPRCSWLFQYQEARPAQHVLLAHSREPNHSSTLPTSALRLASTLPHLHRELASPLPHMHRGLGSPLPHIYRGLGSPLPHLHLGLGARTCASESGTDADRCV